MLLSDSPYSGQEWISIIKVLLEESNINLSETKIRLYSCFI